MSSTNIEATALLRSIQLEWAWISIAVQKTQVRMLVD